ncbi:hypothetical protein AAOE16_01010 [Ekhidna sp. MALMAid0563]|uniref:hypothetical protein n=1 Tax=Ekhidna sp. MALMAid0563 TaxID=3143937 RepID=UPI0032DFE245
MESLDGESKTGKWLYEDIVPLTYADEKFQVKYYDIQRKTELFELFKEIRKEVGSILRLPIIHIEAHGDESGFEIAKTKEEITWTELSNTLAEINFATRNNIILSLGICNGYYINLEQADRFRNGQRCAYAINISPQKKIDWNEIKFGYSNFYQCLLKQKDFGSAMDQMREVTPLNILTTADSTAHQIADYVKKFLLDPIRVSDQLKGLIEKGNELLPGKNFNRNFKALKNYKREFGKNQLIKKWDHFLMMDSFEENRTKFPDFELIWDKL